tara:strand:+ start:221 stop:556 length:336 start_codon:yes stop_codon:yes gene_type:complete
MTKINDFGLYYLIKKSWSSNYIVGYTHDFDTTKELIEEINPAYQVITFDHTLYIQFYRLDIMKQFVDIKVILNIKNFQKIKNQGFYQIEHFMLFILCLYFLHLILFKQCFI